MGQVVDFEKIAQEQIHVDLGAVFRGAIRMSLELLLEEEVKAMVGARRYERSGARRGHRNGTYLRGLLTSMGHIDVQVPRTRDGSAAGVIGSYQRRSDEIDALVTEAYVSGVSQRKMADVTESLMGKRVSKSVVSRVAKRLEQTVEQLRTEVNELPACKMMVFQGPPFEDKDFEQAISSLWDVMKSYKPETYGFAWADDDGPRFQLKPEGYRGYIEGRPVRAM